MSARSDCRKFAPNIFNKSKCTNCFRQKEEHSAEALECNRASRKVSKCGYLFVAPGWDFSNPLNRTKRWQRRWFVLYDDGELTYSLDEHPDTVPQACVDMTLVLEVRDADEVTGHPHSLAIAAPDRVTFVKGACREEAKWWSDVLSVFPRSKGRHKRNATFPGGQATSLLQNGTTIRNGVGNGARPRHNSCHAGGWAAPPRPATVADIPTSATPVSSLPPTPTPPLATPETKVYTDQPVSSASPPTRDKINSEDKARSRRGAARERRRAAWDAAAAQDESSEAVHHRILLEEYDEESKREEKLKDIAASLTRPRERPPLSPPNNTSSQTLPEPPTRETTSSGSVGPTMDDVDSSIPDKYVRGDPDGCVRGAAARVELPAEGLLNMRKGWLLRQAGQPSASSPSAPSQHWFVLRGAALLYYRDPSAEDCGIMDGVIDLNGVAGVVEAPPARTFGFLIKTWDNRQYMLSAMTAGIRANWVSAIRKTAGLPDPTIQCSEKLYADKPIIKLDRQDSIESADSAIIPTSPITPITPMTPRSVMFSSDEEYRTASEGGRRDSVDWGDSISQLPPSPILNRNPISRVKDKVRSRNNQHPSSLPSSPDETPPSDIDETDNIPDRSLREILDPFTPIIKEIIRKDDLAKPLKSSYISTIDKQAIEIDDLRKQLKIAQTDVTLAEKELKRLRQVKSESVLREKRMDELLSTLQKTEEELNMRTKEAENLETLKKMYNQDKNLWESKLSETETFLKDSTEHCELLNRQLANGQETIQRLQEELSQLNERLMRGAEENEALFMKIRDIEGRSSSLSMSRGKGRSVESLSDLTNIDLDQDLESMNKERLIEEYDELRGRFEKAVHEIRAMKRELRESHNLYDELEVTNLSLRRDIKLQEENNESQISMMAARIQDLTQKLSASDKQVRALKHKLQKSEARDKRRSLSLKGKDSFSIGKEVEEKLAELENKITTLEGGIIVPTEAPVIKSPSKPPSPTKEKSPSKEKESSSDSKSLKRMSARLRRKSLDSATSSEPMKVLIRLSSLETKVGNALLNKRDLTTSCESLSQTISDSTTLTDGTEGHSNSSHRHLLDRLQSLENVVILSRNKVNDCICQVSAIRASRNRRSPSPVLDKSYSMKTIERCLTDVSKTLQDCTDKCVLPFESIYEGDLNESVINVVHQLELQLRSKLLDINKKKCALLESGELNQRRNLEFLAEKLAYEAVLISRVNDAVANSNGDSLFKRLIKSEVEETSQLVTSLQSKLNGSQIKRQTLCKTSMDYLAKILSRKINFVNNTSMDKTAGYSQNMIQMKELDMLKASQKEITVTVNQYKTEKLVELTKTLILEALTCETGTFDQDQANIENMRIQEAWHKAQDVVNHELINSEISHVMKRCAQLYGTQLEAEKKGRFTLVASQQAALERWFQVAHQRLSEEMKEAIADITSLYQECLTNVRLRTPINEDRPATDSRQLLNELADVIAHKALIDAKIYVCTGGYETDPQTDGVEKPKGMYADNSWNKSSDSENVVASLDSDPTQEAEFIYLFQHFSNECRALFSDEYTDNKEDLIKISDALRQVELVVKHLHLQIGSDIADSKDDSSRKEQSKTQVQGVLELCESLKKSVEALSSHIPCQHCLRLQSAIDRLRTEHEETLAALKTEQDRGVDGKKSADLLRGRARTAEDLVSSLQQQQRSAQRRVQRSESEVTLLKQQISQHQSECQHLQVQHEQEQTQLKERTRRLERRLGTLDSEYSQQLEQLRSAYHKTIGTDIQGDSIRQRYQAEIEQLRVLCEKGLLAMESSHRRVIQELEDKHRVEREQLRVDKEQALAEETQATLAALDAMRKAHENEVQREVTKFKREFVTRTQHGGDLGEEMEEIKQEILSLSEKYSVKCVESAALEEKLCNVTQQLTQAQQHIMQLDARNKQLRAHLMSEVNEMNSSEIASLGSSSSSKTTRPSQLTLEPAKSVVRKTKIQFAKTESTRNLRLSPVQN